MYVPGIPSRFQRIIDEQVELYEQKRTFQTQNDIPPTPSIPLSNRLHWLRIPDVISVFVDMKGSTQLSAQRHENGTAGAYQLFTGTAVALFHEFNTPYDELLVSDRYYNRITHERVRKSCCSQVLRLSR